MCCLAFDVSDDNKVNSVTYDTAEMGGVLILAVSSSAHVLMEYTSGVIYTIVISPGPLLNTEGTK